MTNESRRRERTCPCCAPRRRVVLGLAGAPALTALSALSGCESKEAEGPVTAVEPDANTSCVLDGMTLIDYPGPKGQVHYSGQSKPEFHCDTVELFSMLLNPEQVRVVRGAFVQDMAKTDWDHPKGAWIDAKTAWYVVGSRRKGSMGPTFVSFARREDAESFAKEYGGAVHPFAEVTPGMSDLSGGARNDTRM